MLELANSQLYRPGINSGAPSLSYERQAGRLKREESVIRWVDLLDKFKMVQERSRRSRNIGQREFYSDRFGANHPSVAGGLASSAAAAMADSNGGRDKPLPDIAVSGPGANTITRSGAGAEAASAQKGHRPRSSLANFGRLSSIGQRKMKK